jgi:DNA-binding GntR family transcriptional regulator
MCTASSAEKWASLKLEFRRHLTVSQLKTRLFDMVENLSAIARPYVMLSMYVKQDLMESNNREHAQLLDAYRSGDVRAVGEQTRIHLPNTRDAIVACVVQ